MFRMTARDKHPVPTFSRSFADRGGTGGSCTISAAGRPVRHWTAAVSVETGRRADAAADLCCSALVDI
jgi:hypothetical protein